MLENRIFFLTTNIYVHCTPQVLLQLITKTVLEGTVNMSRSLTSTRQPVVCFIILFLLDTMAAEEMERDGDIRIQGKNFRAFYTWLDPVSSFRREWNLNFAELIPIYVPKFSCKIANLITNFHTYYSPGSPFAQNSQESPAPALGKPKYGKVGIRHPIEVGKCCMCFQPVLLATSSTTASRLRRFPCVWRTSAAARPGARWRRPGGQSCRSRTYVITIWYDENPLNLFHRVHENAYCLGHYLHIKLRQFFHLFSP